jgi:hypothetical protein
MSPRQIEFYLRLDETRRKYYYQSLPPSQEDINKKMEYVRSFRKEYDEIEKEMRRNKKLLDRENTTFNGNIPVKKNKRSPKEHDMSNSMKDMKISYCVKW